MNSSKSTGIQWIIKTFQWKSTQMEFSLRSIYPVSFGRFDRWLHVEGKEEFVDNEIIVHIDLDRYVLAHHSNHKVGGRLDGVEFVSRSRKFSNKNNSKWISIHLIPPDRFKRLNPIVLPFSIIENISGHSKPLSGRSDPCWSGRLVSRSWFSRSCASVSSSGC